MQHQANTTIHHPRMVTFGGYAMILFAVLFIGITLLIDYLASQSVHKFTMEQHGLFTVALGSPTITWLLVLYALTPLLLIPAAVGAYYLFGHQFSPEMRVGMYFAAVSVLAMCLSMLMLPSFNSLLSAQVPNLTDQSQNLALVILQSMHSYFGIFVGDILGLGSLFIWLMIASIVSLRSFIFPRSIAWACLIVALILGLVLFLRYTYIWPQLYYNIRVGAIIGLWFVLFGANMVGVGRDLFK